MEDAWGSHHLKVQGQRSFHATAWTKFNQMRQDKPIVYVLDDDYRVRETLSSLLSSVGLNVKVFASVAEYLEFEKADSPACLILDLELPDMMAWNFSVRLRVAMRHPLFCHRTRRRAIVCTCHEGWGHRVSAEAF
jgi:CheY-like chemotaxis protein